MKEIERGKLKSKGTQLYTVSFKEEDEAVGLFVVGMHSHKPDLLSRLRRDS
jgi:hypothetical protein